MSTEETLSEQGVFKGAEGLRGLAECQAFWDEQPYGTRLYFGHGAADYLHRGVLQSAIAALNVYPPAAKEAVEILVSLGYEYMNGEGGLSWARPATQPQAPQGAVTDKSHIVVTKTVEGAIVAVTRQDDEGRITEIIAQDTQKPAGEKIGGKCQRILRAEGVPYPRTCQVCGLGKCHYTSPAAPNPETPEGKK